MVPLMGCIERLLAIDSRGCGPGKVSSLPHMISSLALVGAWVRQDEHVYHDHSSHSAHPVLPWDQIVFYKSYGQILVCSFVRARLVSSDLQASRKVRSNDRDVVCEARDRLEEPDHRR